jgi:hypothetical protein
MDNRNANDIKQNHPVSKITYASSVIDWFALE